MYGGRMTGRVGQSENEREGESHKGGEKERE